MKPLSIKMSGFGSYPYEVIDFSEVQQGIFLITGNTGSGKTTIFDAITYALFNTTSGGERDGEMMCSQYAKEGTETYVDFRFTSDGEEYQIIRSPRQRKWKKKTDEDGKEYFEQLKTDKPSQVELILPNGESYPGKNAEIDEKILEIIRLNPKQFTQVAMMSQGDFVKLLKAPSKERKNIFAGIFDTAFYGMMEQEFKNLERNMSEKLEENNQEWSKNVERLIALPQSEFLEKYEEIRGFQEGHKDEMIEVSKLILKESENEKNRLEKEHTEIQMQLDGIKQNLMAAKQINEIFDQYEFEERKKEEIEKRREEIEQKKQRADMGERAELVERDYQEFQKLIQDKKDLDEKIKELEAFKIENEQTIQTLTENETKAKKIYEKNMPKLQGIISKLQGMIPQYEVLDQVKRKKAVNKQEQLEKERRKKTLLMQEKKYNKELALVKEKVDECQKKQENTEFIEQQEKILKNQKSNLNELKEMYQNRMSQKNEEVKYKALIEQEEEKVKKERDEYNQMYHGFIDGQAIILAKNLVEGEPCPVCGNTHHIKKPEQHFEVVEKEKLEEKKRQLDQDEKKLADYKEKYQNYKSNLLAFDSMHMTLFKRLECEMDLKKYGSINQTVLRELSQKLDESIEENEKRKRELRQNQEILKKCIGKNAELEEALKQIGIQKEGLEECLKECAIKNAKLETQEEALNQQLEFSNKEAAEEALTQYKSELEWVEKNYRNAQREKNEAEQKKQNNLGMLRSEYENRNKIIEAGKSAEQMFLMKLKQQNFQNTEDFKNSRYPHEKIEQYKQEIEVYNRDKIANSQALILLEKQTKGKQRIQTEVYVKKEQEMQAKGEENFRRNKEIYTIVQTNQEVVNSLIRLKNQRDGYLKKYEIISNLDNTANGKMSRKHLNFQTYILRKYFKEVIYRANKKLRVMSNEQFILECVDIDDLTGQGEVGLNMNVYSLVNDEARDIKTLSGGESFMAALAMELGLSEMIQQRVGSVRVETMFIDEGFGSLDEEARNQAIRILSELSGNNRLIGIISHVTELKAMVETKLQITKTEKGSSARWINE